MAFPKYAPADAVTVEELPEGDISDYRFADGQFRHDPVPVETTQTPSCQDGVWVAYTAMMTDTLLEV